MRAGKSFTLDRDESLPQVKVPPAWVDRVGRWIATAAVFFMVAYAAGVTLVSISGDVGGEARQVDFAALWSAGKLALAGDPVGAFDQAKLRAAQSLPSDAEEGELFWLYPPGMQLFLVPFALLPYWAAWLTFGILSLATFVGSLWSLARPVPMGQSVLIGAPIVLITLSLGQISLIWVALLVAAFAAIARDRPALAGALIGVLSLKPQLGLLLPLALAADRRWSVLSWACVGVVMVHGLPTLIVGTEYWGVFFERMGAVTISLSGGGTPHRLMVTPYAFLRFFGMSHSPAFVGQLAVTAILAIGVLLLWSRRQPRVNLCLGFLLMAIPVATPYAYYYELAIALPGAIFLVRGGYGANRVEWSLLALVTLGPAALWVWTPVSPLFAPVVLAICAHTFLIAWRGERLPHAVDEAGVRMRTGD